MLKASLEHLRNAFKTLGKQSASHRLSSYTGGDHAPDYLIQLESSQDIDVARVFKDGPCS